MIKQVIENQQWYKRLEQHYQTNDLIDIYRLFHPTIVQCTLDIHQDRPYAAHKMNLNKFKRIQVI